MEKTGAIVLIRNPYEAILSEFNRRRGHGHTSHAKLSEFHSDFWSLLVHREAGRWFNIYYKYIVNKNVKVLFYEDLKRDLANTMSDTLHFI